LAVQRSFLQKIWRRLVFWAGDTRSSDAFPWFTWAKDELKMRMEESQDAIPKVQYGDVGLHRLSGYMSNLFIPGFMVHAWVHTDDGFPGKIVEAVSEGVLYQSPIYPIHSDYTIIVRPLDVTDEERKGACLKAKQIVGEEYDENFEFDIPYELQFYHDRNKTKAEQHLREAQKQLQKYHPAFTCTEVAAYAWWHKKEQLRIKRVKSGKRKIILADTFINPKWKIIWMSNSVTVESAKSYGVKGQALKMIEDYRAENPIKEFDPSQKPLD
jgi:uncharacterized protein YycO